MSVFPNLDEWGTRADRISTQLDELTAALKGLPLSEQISSPQLTAWEPFALYDGGQTSNTGGLTVGGNNSALCPAPVGWEAYVKAVAITVTGASSAATVASYNGDLGDTNLFDYANALLGSSPSRIVAFYDDYVVYCEQGDRLTFVIAGAVASQNVTVRVTGMRRMLGADVDRR